MIFVDDLVDHGAERTRGLPSRSWCHMVSDVDADELHEIARRIGLRREWFQCREDGSASAAHYDLTPGRRQKAVELGAAQVSSRELVALNYDGMARRRRKAGVRWSELVVAQGADGRWGQREVRVAHRYRVRVISDRSLGRAHQYGHGEDLELLVDSTLDAWVRRFGGEASFRKDEDCYGISAIVLDPEAGTGRALVTATDAAAATEVEVVRRHRLRVISDRARVGRGAFVDHGEDFDLLIDRGLGLWLRRVGADHGDPFRLQDDQSGVSMIVVDNVTLGIDHLVTVHQKMADGDLAKWHCLCGVGSAGLIDTAQAYRESVEHEAAAVPGGG